MAETLTPELLGQRFAAAAVVKENPVREVRRDGEFFYKLDRRGGYALRREFAAARLLEERRVPVVEHLWFGRIAPGFVLVTRALEGAPSVREYLRTHFPDAEFRLKFADFIRDFLATGLGHDDLHIGNILYRIEDGRFVLVDVRAVRRRRWRRFPYGICRAPLELRRDLTRAEVCGMLKRLGLPDAEAFYDRGLEKEAAALRKMWPKRRAQVLAGYPKFTRREGDLLISTTASPAELADPEFRPGNETEFCSSFYWDLAEIPHRRALVFDARNGRIGYERTPEPSPLAERELAERRRIFAPPPEKP